MQPLILNQTNLMRQCIQFQNGESQGANENKRLICLFLTFKWKCLTSLTVDIRLKYMFVEFNLNKENKLLILAEKWFGVFLVS